MAECLQNEKKVSSLFFMRMIRPAEVTMNSRKFEVHCRLQRKRTQRNIDLKLHWSFFE